MGLEAFRARHTYRRGDIIGDGEIINASGDPCIQGARRFNELFAAEPRVQATATQTVGKKGYDGVAMAIVINYT